ncbi:PTS transporter subunit EIIC [Desemzia incerta]|uniref:PTS transporter subunit EIIC n=1 Tax=Desemzia incerta TaxID=82801 RepID=UPI0024C35393|nr:PTS transporter subunit EIIC [Desemzia incerta]WHZ32884.1 PTS transporter subunit EIIC [Desemzia incerta]
MTKSEKIEKKIQEIVGNEYSVLLRNSFIQLAPIMTILGIGLFSYAILLQFGFYHINVWTMLSTNVYGYTCIGASFLIMKKMVGKSQGNNNEIGVEVLIYLALFLFTYASSNPSLTLLTIGSTSIIPSLILGFIYHIIYQLVRKLELRNPKASTVPQAVIDVLNNTWYHGIVLLGTIIVSMFSPLYDWLVKLSLICLNFFNQPIIVGMIILVICLFWWKGIHGVTVIGLFLRPFWFQMLALNGAAYLTQQTIPYIFHESFFQWVIWIGGSGATIGLSICLKLFSKSKRFKLLAKTGIVSTIFNINETVMYGMPIANNRYLVIPFILSPLINGLVGYWFITQGFLENIFLTVPWVFPAPLGLFFATGGDLTAILVSSLLIFFSTVIYFPFFIKIDKLELFKEQLES